MPRRVTLNRLAIFAVISAMALACVSPCLAGNKKKKQVPEPAPPIVALPLLDTLPAGLFAAFPLPVVPLPPDPVKVLLAGERAAYKSGVEAYQSGHLGKARIEFDRAMELMLTSGLDLRENPELEHELEQLVDNVHSFELAALKEGDGFTERPPVLAAIDEVADISLPPVDTKQLDPKVLSLMEHGIADVHSDLPLVLNEHVLRYINYFSTRGRGGILASWRRAGKYREMISRVLREEGVPQDLIYLAQAESAFQPTALSRAGARGMWQFMAFTGKLYGLDVNWWQDKRQDPELATRAAAHHLHDLYRQFGDWYLAMAAYNSGPFNVQHAIERTGYADFWELFKRNQLPQQTRNYVPIILAVTIMAKNPAQYGLTEVEPDLPVPTETVKLSTPTDLRLIAETIDCNVELLQELNPSLLRWVTPKDDFDLRIPSGAKQRFEERIAAIPEDKRVWWRWHKVSEGESLAQIAKSYKTSPAAIAQVNNLEANADLAVGASLVIPITPKNPSLMAAATDGAKTRTVNLHYRVRKGETLAVVASRFGVTTADLETWNKLKTNAVAPGRVLAVRAVLTGHAAAPAEPKSASAKRHHATGTAVAQSGKPKAAPAKSAGKASPTKTASPATANPKTAPKVAALASMQPSVH